MAQNTYYPEEVLIEKMERGEYGWLDYVNHIFCRMAGRTGGILQGALAHD